ncbi:hypothetical protein [Sulfitobacter donghicola]|uniref:Co-chaperone DjlA N-terminal domain-containing protein n=1 Tax=Sulfitobacter donghicola DSW-25 = KCTC 12864 = JCM 14565 TaxID=1300350 RepID=A0A073IJG3_9RHOB|nr:hypothetical protein [Sulfitobacter donghicola]KEJ89651.1 hypothetical protein DSW25_10240 [Sulfitobacter donghicola DSW-25 = KCTC 12864 = JCM 14565]KIN69196.1 hypothetical protein Z948_2935 [Sulfitobacter donghicola DSW-25 = KCTC 12864 = JCM 14565]
MIYILVICGALGAAYFLFRHFQRGAYVIGSYMEAPAEVRAAAKRVGFKAQPNVHSITSLHSPELCVAAMAFAFAQMDDNQEPCEETLAKAVSKHLQVDPLQIDDFCTLAPWLVDQGGGPTPAFDRLTKRLKQLDHGPYFGKMMNVLGDMTAAGTKGMPSARQADAMGALARIFRTA